MLDLRMRLELQPASNFQARTQCEGETTAELVKTEAKEKSLVLKEAMHLDEEDEPEDSMSLNSNSESENEDSESGGEFEMNENTTSCGKKRKFDNEESEEEEEEERENEPPSGKRTTLVHSFVFQLYSLSLITIHAVQPFIKSSFC